MRSIIAALIVLTTLSAAYAGYPDNPDRYTSITFLTGFTGGSGEYETTVGDTDYPQDINPNAFGASATLTTPVSNNISLIVQSTLSSLTIKEEDNEYYYASKSSFTAYSFNVGFKIYFK